MITVSEGFDSATWSDIPVTNPLHSADWLRVMGSRIPGVPRTVSAAGQIAWYGTIIDDPEAYEAYNPAAILLRDPPVFPLPDEDRRRRALTAIGKPADLLPALVLVAPGYLGDPAGPAAGDTGVISECLHDLAAWCRGEGLAGLYILYSSSAAVAQAIVRLGGISFPLTDRCVMPVWWHDADSYLAGLSPKRRGEIRRQRRRIADADMTLSAIEVTDRVEEILDARCMTLRRYGQAADRGAELRRLQGLEEAFGGRLACFAALRDGSLVSYVVAVRHQRSLNVVHGGVTQAGRRLPFAHFAAAYYAVIEHTSRADYDEIDYGIGHIEGKVLRGCAVTAMNGHAISFDQSRKPALAAAAELLRGRDLISPATQRGSAEEKREDSVEHGR